MQFFRFTKYTILISKNTKKLFIDELLLTFGFLFMIVVVLGSFFTCFSGPSLSWIGLGLLYCNDVVPTNYWILEIALLFTIVILILDKVIPDKGLKFFVGSTYGIWETIISLIIGIFLPFTYMFILCPFLVAIIGELIYDSKDRGRAFNAATDSFFRFLASSFMGFIVCMMYLGLFIWIINQNYFKNRNTFKSKKLSTKVDSFSLV